MDFPFLVLANRDAFVLVRVRFFHRSSGRDSRIGNP